MYTRLSQIPRSLEATQQKLLSQALAVGQGFNIFGPSSSVSLLGPLFDFSSIPTKKIDFFGTEVEVPVIVNWLEGTDTFIVEGYGQTRSDFQRSISAHLGISAHYGGFSGEVQSSFETDSSTTVEQKYSYKKFFSSLGIFQYQPGHEAYLTTEFKAAIDALPSTVNPQDIKPFEDFFNRFGAYFVTRAFPGAALTYGATTSSTSGMSSEAISASAKASYNALFAGISIDAEFKASETWRSYTANTKVRVSSRGGDTALAAKLASANPFAPDTSATSGAFLEWVQSAKLDPTNTDFRVSGIWELAGNKRSVIEQAWNEFGPKIKPLLTITSTVFSHPEEHTPERPFVQLNNKSLRPSPASGNMGFNILILDGNDLMAEPLFNRQFGYNAESWWYEFTDFWNNMAREINASGFAINPNLLVLASYNGEWNSVPTDDFAEILINAGAAKVFREWIDDSDPGSVIGNSRLTLHPANLIFVGFFGGVRGSALEVYNYVAYSDSAPMATTLNVEFNLQTSGTRYVIDSHQIN